MVTSVKLVVLGDGGVGKTALTIRLCLNHFIEVFTAFTYDPTIEDSYRKHAIIDDEPYLLEILDTAGQEDYTSLRSQWIREGDGFLVVYSTTSRSSFLRIHEFIQQITRVKDSDRVPIVLVGNKVDRINEREVETREGAELAKRLGCEFVETSAKTREGLEKAYHTAVRLIQGQNPNATNTSNFNGANGGAGGGKVKKQKKQRKCTII
ncbi:uncharacterized protein JCM6883_003043 [Sporobolomyces salmoneus]|uniref:uncharacterized protein n=1 Tax=Sporobolomyces salmoneus TaxID=183962 RepID=UPI00316E50CE